MRTKIKIGFLLLVGIISCSDPGTAFDNETNEIILGIDDFYFDNECRIQLQAYIINESRCPTGAMCIWSGYAAARFELIVDGNTEHTFDLATIDNRPYLRTDTLLSGIKYTLLDITPYPDLSKEYKAEDYKVKVLLKK